MIGKPLEPVIEGKRETEHPFVTLQTGEQPDDPFFDRGHIIVTTYDQVLSGLLCGPYGLSNRLHNVNAAAIAGALDAGPVVVRVMVVRAEALAALKSISNSPSVHKITL